MKRLQHMPILARDSNDPRGKKTVWRWMGTLSGKQRAIFFFKSLLSLGANSFLKGSNRQSWKMSTFIKLGKNIGSAVERNNQPFCLRRRPTLIYQLADASEFQQLPQHYPNQPAHCLCILICIFVVGHANIQTSFGAAGYDLSVKLIIMFHMSIFQ